MDRVLVVDDITQNAELMVTYLRTAGYEVVTAGDGVAGIRKAKTFKPDLIVLDLIMPKMSGFDVCKTLKSDPETKDIIIMVVTAMASKESRTRAFELGADEYMEKTFDKAMFLAKIKSLLRVKSLSDKLRDNYAVLEEHNRQYEIQLEMAKHIQSALASEYNFTLNNTSFASCYKPAHGVSGDIFDIVTLGPQQIGIFISDVSGHGVSSALLTSMLKIMFKNMAEIHPDSENLLYNMNKEFCKIFSNSSVNIYACAFYAVIDLRERKMHYSNAGGSFPIYMNNKTRECKELQLAGKPLGLIEGTLYAKQTMDFNEGDCFFFQTDGLCDSLYKDEPDVYVSKLSELLLEVTEGDSPSKPEEIIEYAINQFYNMSESSKYENDDVSVIVCQIGKRLYE